MTLRQQPSISQSMSLEEILSTCMEVSMSEQNIHLLLYNSIDITTISHMGHRIPIPRAINFKLLDVTIVVIYLICGLKLDVLNVIPIPQLHLLHPSPL